MDQLSPSLEQQRYETIDHARAGLDMVFAHFAQLPEKQQQLKCNNLASLAAGYGLWGIFSDYYGSAAASSLVENSTDGTLDWITQFAAGGSFEIAACLADKVDFKDKPEAYLRIARAASQLGDVAVTLEFAGLDDTLDENTKERAHPAVSQLFEVLTSQGRWQEAEHLGNVQPIDTYYLLQAASHAANQSEQERVVTLVNRAIEQNPIASQGRSDVDESDWLEKPIKNAVRVAFINDDYIFIARIGSDIAWPKDAVPDWKSWIKAGIMEGVEMAEDYETGIAMAIAAAIEAGENRRAYIRLQQALDDKDWAAIEDIASEVNSNVLGLVECLASKANQQEVSDKISAVIYSRGFLNTSMGANYQPLLKIMLQEAQQTNWQKALELKEMFKSYFLQSDAQKLIKTAISQDRYDVMLDIVKIDRDLLEFAVSSLQNQGQFAAAEDVAAGWLKKYLSDESEVYWFRRNLLNLRAPLAAKFGDWQLVRATLHELDTLTQDDNLGHQTYELVAIEALDTLQAILSCN